MKKTIKVSGMTCHSCETIIKEEVEELKGVSRCEVSAKNGDVIVDFDESITPLSKIKEVIEEEGYKVD
jgi:copper chaperone CopZ